MKNQNSSLSDGVLIKNQKLDRFIGTELDPLKISNAHLAMQLESLCIKVGDNRFKKIAIKEAA